MRIIEVRGENFKRLTAIEIKPRGPVTPITGKNGSGKSSALDLIEWLLGGAKHAPDMPIRRGANEMSGMLKTEEFTITRKARRRADGEVVDSVIIEGKDGMRAPKPQQFLDGFYTDRCLDPQAFSRMSPKEQAAELRRVVGLDTSKLDAERERVFATRTEANREVKRLDTELAAIVVPEVPAVIGEEIDLAEVADKKRQADAVRADNEVKRSEVDRLTMRQSAINDDIRKIREGIDALQRQLSSAISSLATVNEDRLSAITIATALIDPDIAAIDREIAAAKVHNADVYDRKRRADNAATIRAIHNRTKKGLEDATAKVAKLKDRLDAIDAEKAEMLAAAKFPIPGMSVEGDQVLIAGVPFSQASTAEQIRAGLAMAGAMNPKLRLVLIRDGSLLDAESMQLVEDYAASNDLDVWIETISSDSPNAIVIEDGRVSERPVAAKEPVTA